MKIEVGILVALACVNLACADNEFAVSAPITLDMTDSPVRVLESGGALMLDYSSPVVGGKAMLLDNGGVPLETFENGTTNWTTEISGMHELQYLIVDDGGGVLFSSNVQTCEVWAVNAVFDRVDIPLKEQLPNSWPNIRTISFSEGVTGVCDGFFEGCDIVGVNYPSTLEDFGYGDLLPDVRSSLTYDTNGFMIYNGWVLGFQNKNASDVSVPEGVIGIGKDAFADMYDLETVQLPKTLKYIGTRAFRNDTYLDNLLIPDGVEVIGNDAFNDCSYVQTLTLGTGLRKIGDGAFSGCSQLARVSFAEGLSSIGKLAFNGCWRMQSVALPLSVESVAMDAFSGCTSLTGVTVPTHVATMEEWFRPVYTQIVDVMVADGETEVCDSMFSNCTALVEAVMPEGLTNIADNVFCGCTRLTSIVLPSTVESIGACVFRDCTALTAVVLPENVSSIGAYAFSGCISLDDVTLSRELRIINDHVFAGCSRLRSFVVPEHVEWLGANICDAGVTAIYFLGNAPDYDVNVYASTCNGMQTYVINGTKGWDGRPQSRDLLASWPVDNAYTRPISFWTANEFDVVFDANGGIFALGATNTYSCAQVTYTGYSLPPYHPVRGGYRFNGYWTEITGGTRVTSATAVKLTKTHTLYAQWIVAPSITARFNAMGGTVGPGTQVYTSGEPFGSFPVPTREHYNFDGWYTAASGGSRVTEGSEAPAADTEFFARWRPKLYEILYHSNNGADMTASQLFTYGDSVTLIANPFSCSGCTFIGWALTPGGEALYAAGKKLEEVSAVQGGTIHLYATWTGRTYAVRFDSNGGQGRMPNQTFVLGVAQPVSTNLFVREGFIFRGWSYLPSGGVEIEDGAMAIGLTEQQGATVVLYAVWARDGYSLEEALGGAGVTLVVSGDADWVTDTEMSHDGVVAVETAELPAAPAGKTTSTTLTATIRGNGSGSFWWKVSCEEEYFGDWYDYAVFSIDGEEKARIAGDVDWSKVDYEIVANGTHTLTWTFVRDDFDEDGAEWENRLWVDEFIWNRDLSSYTVSDILDEPKLSFTTGGAVPWVADTTTNHDGVVAMASGAITHSQESWIETTVNGAGSLSFWWKVCGQTNGSRLYDYLKCELDGELVCRAGSTDWTNIVVEVTSTGTHVVRWTYLKNASVDAEYDRAWLDQVSWSGAAELSVIVPAGVTGKSDILIPPSWFDRYPLFVGRFGRDRAAAMLMPTGKRGPGGAPRYVWHDFVAGTDPTNVRDDFRARVDIVAGRPVITWEPALNGIGVRTGGRVYRVFGRTTFNGTWHEVAPGHEMDYRLFKVTVEMP